MSSPAAADKKAIRLARPPKAFVPFMAWVIHALQRLAAAAGFSLQIAGASRASVNANGGFEIATKGGSDALVVSTPVWGIRDDFKIAPGTIGGRTPTYGGTAISPVGSAPAVPLTGSVQLFFKITFSITKDSAGFLATQSVSTVEIVTSNGGDSESIKYIQFQESVSGVWSQPMLTGSQGASLCNTGPNATNLVLTRL